MNGRLRKSFDEKDLESMNNEEFNEEEIKLLFEEMRTKDLD